MVRVLFLGGLGRCGTTLLERVLGELPGVHPLGEVVQLWQRSLRDDDPCSCGTSFSHCEFWQSVGKTAFGGWSKVDTARVLELRRTVERTRDIPLLAAPRLTASQHAMVTAYAEYYHRVYAAAAEVSGARVLVDSSKHGALAYCLRWAPDVDLRVVHLVRDSRDLAYSWNKARPELPSQGCTPSRSALLWNAHNAAFGLLSRVGVPVRRIRYEALLANPRGAIHALAAYAGLDTSTVDLSFLGRDPDGTEYAELRPGHSAAGSLLRFAVGRISLRRDDAWRSCLAPSQRRLVAALTAPLLGAYGYPLLTV